VDLLTVDDGRGRAAILAVDSAASTAMRAPNGYRKARPTPTAAHTVVVCTPTTKSTPDYAIYRRVTQAQVHSATQSMASNCSNRCERTSFPVASVGLAQFGALLAAELAQKPFQHLLGITTSY
jgi:hypothetical protein